MPKIISPELETEIRRLIAYDPATGVFTWLINRGYGGNGAKAGAVAGTLHVKGYWSICVCYQPILAHRLAWFLTYGVWPRQLDHIDRNRLNNRIANLRVATQSQNNANTGRRKTNKSGFKGVCLEHRTGKFVAYIRRDNRQTSLGTFKTPEEAHAAYCQAAGETYGEYARGE